MRAVAESLELADVHAASERIAGRVCATAGLSSRLCAGGASAGAGGVGSTTGMRRTDGRGCMRARRKPLRWTAPRSVIDGAPFASARLRETLEQAGAHSVILVAVGAGPEAEEEAQRRWADEKPDEYFFLEMYASAVVEHLTTTTGARLCDWAEQHGMAVLPHYSPGYPEWDVAEQPRLLALMKRTRKRGFSFGAGSAGVRHVAAAEIATGRFWSYEAHRTIAPTDRAGAV